MLFRAPYSAELVVQGVDCTICLSPFAEGNTLIYLPCTGYHHFHEQCIIAWLKRNSVCPICKQVITEQFIRTTPITQEALRNYFTAVRRREHEDTRLSHVEHRPLAGAFGKEDKDTDGKNQEQQS